jgi:hypothetical protein
LNRRAAESAENFLGFFLPATSTPAAFNEGGRAQKNGVREIE